MYPHRLNVYKKIYNNKNTYKDSYIVSMCVKIRFSKKDRKKIILFVILRWKIFADKILDFSLIKYWK